MFHPHEKNLIDFRQPRRGPIGIDIGTYSASTFHLQTPLLHIVCLDYVHARGMFCHSPLAGSKSNGAAVQMSGIVMPKSLRKLTT